MKPQIQLTRYRNHKLYATKTIILSLGLILISILGLSCLSSAVFEERNTEAVSASELIEGTLIAIHNTIIIII